MKTYRIGRFVVRYAPSSIFLGGREKWFRRIDGVNVKWGRAIPAPHGGSLQFFWKGTADPAARYSTPVLFGVGSNLPGDER